MLTFPGVGLVVDQMRTNGSCRFATYYKVQVWQPISFAWKDLQKAFASIDEAAAAMPSGGKARIMEISEKGRFPVEARAAGLS
jgi:hypothetical protein